MNLAFAALFIVFLLLPGIILRRSYLSSKFSSRYINTTIQDEVYWALVPSLLFHFAGYYIASFFDCKIDLRNIGILLMGTNDQLKISEIFGSFSDFLVQIFLYNFILWVIAYIGGHILRIVVRTKGIDIIFSTVRFSNPWFYWFNGEYRDILEIESNNYSLVDKLRLLFKGDYASIKNRVGFVYVDVLTTIGGKSYIYTGILEDFYMDNLNGGLDRIILKYPSRRNFDDDPDKSNDKTQGKKMRHFEPDPNDEDEHLSDDRYYDIPGNYLSIPYANIVNLNISYFTLEIEDHNK